MAPEASIIIPNYNNGRESSHDGRTDLLGDLLRSIESAFAHQPSRVEVLIGDDGSTDDSLQTARAWAARCGGESSLSCRLFEFEHSGVLSSMLNRLMAATTSPLVFRFDGDIVLFGEHWLESALRHFASDERLGVLGGCQLAPDGSVLGLGDLLFHPHGYQHLGAGLPGTFSFDPLEPDHVMGCCHIMRRSAFESIGAYDESILRGQTVDLTVRLRQAGWTLRADPSLRYEHRLALRRNRPSRSDRPEGIKHSRRIFHEKWGFDRLCPDMDQMRARLGTKLVPPAELPEGLSRTGIDSDSEALENRAHLVRNLVVPGRPVRIGSFGSGDGRLETALARDEILVTSLEDRPSSVDSARSLAAEHPDHRIPYLVEDLAQVQLPDDSFDLLLVDRVLERHPNPIALLKECHRLLSAEGVLILLVSWWSPEQQLQQPRALGRMTPSGLRSLLQNSGMFRSIAFRDRPFPRPEPDLLVYALRSLEGQPPEVGEPTLCR
ncbi:MAG: hypothetical protein CBC35_08555 [Planctomycetes bacterium TMED75]|nr:hypothetical protein [Planctomycetaceae bacterium]OUU91883.1 MAG: hypothetical protein CBC35_08555 [Planctomycetes bacterium TMED75]